MSNWPYPRIVAHRGGGVVGFEERIGVGVGEAHIAAAVNWRRRTPWRLSTSAPATGTR